MLLRFGWIVFLAFLVGGCAYVSWPFSSVLEPEGYLDARFDGDGKLVLENRGLATLIGMAIRPVRQKDGKLVVAAYTAQGFALARFTPEGVLDTAFGLNGLVQLYDVNVDQQPIRQLLQQRDGKLVLIGNRAHLDGAAGSTFYLARFLPDGQVDTAFGDEGVVATRMALSSTAATAIEVSDGGLLVGGSACVEAEPPSPSGQHVCINTDFALARYLSDGQLDPRFGWKGIHIIPLTRLKEAVRVILPMQDRKLLLLGSSGSDVAWVRLDEQGRLDEDFADGKGKAVLLYSVSGEKPLFVYEVGGGRILLAGTRVELNGEQTLLLQRYRRNGKLDGGFGEEGTYEIQLGMGSTLNSFIQLPDEKWLVASETCLRQKRVTFNNARLCLESDLALMRLHASGKVDTGFGQDGTLVTSVSSSRDKPIAVLPDDNGDLLLLVRSCREHSCRDWDLAMVRITPHKQKTAEAP